MRPSNKSQKSDLLRNWRESDFSPQNFNLTADMAGGAAVSTSGRPVLKGLHNATIKKNLIIAIGLSFAGMFAYKFIVNDPKKRDYAEFYK